MSVAKTMTAIDAGWQHCYVQTNQIQLHCVTQGEGELVLLLHGFPEFWYAWRFQIPILARHFKVVVPDLRGYNDSDKPAQGYDLDTLAADIRGLITSFGYDQAHIVGHDWGGAIAWHLAQTVPQSIQRLAMLSAVPSQRFFRELVSNFDHLWRNWHVLAFQVPGVSDWWLHQNLKEFVKNWLQGHAVRKGAFSKEETELYESALEKPGALSAVLNYYRPLWHPGTWWRQWTRANTPITTPTLVLWGEDDTFLNRNLTQEFAPLVKAPFKLTMVPQCGHWVQQEAPQTVNRELLSFLRHETPES